MKREEIRNKINDVFWIILEDIIEKYDIHERTSDMIINRIVPDYDFWEYGYSVYKADTRGVVDRIRIKVENVSKFRNIIAELKSDKKRIESIIGVGISIESYEPTPPQILRDNGVDPRGTIYIKIDWKSISNRVDDFKSFVKHFFK